MTDCSWVTVLEIHRRVARPSLTSDGCWMKRITNQYSASVSGTNSCQLQSEHLLIKWSKKTIVVYTYFYRICRMFYIRSYYLWFDHFLQLMEVNTPKIKLKDQSSLQMSAMPCHLNCSVGFRTKYLLQDYFCLLRFVYIHRYKFQSRFQFQYCTWQLRWESESGSGSVNRP